MGMAGLWETWRSPAGERIRSFTIITSSILRGPRVRKHEEYMITLQTKVCIAGEIVTLGDVIEMNELDFSEVSEALTREGVYRTRRWIE